MSNLPLFFKQVPLRALFKAVLLGLILITGGCQPSDRSDTDQKGKEITPHTPVNEAPGGESELTDNVAPTPLQLAYARALRLAEEGDSATLSLCDSLLSFQGVKGGAEPYYYKGIYYETKGDKKKAILFFDKTIQADYTFYEAYIEKAALLIESKAFPAAAKELELLRSLSPGYAPVHYWWGKWAEKQGNDQQALEHYRMALSLDGTMKEAGEAIERLEK